MPELTQTVETSIEFEVFCDRCGAGMCSNTEVTIGRSRGIPQLRITPCDKCLDNERKEGYNEGYEEGKDEGYTDCIEAHNA